VLAPAVVLVRPQLAENIGAAARAMANFGLSDLRLVAPRHGWPQARAIEVAAGGETVAKGARVFDGLAAAVGDLQRLYATTARRRQLVKPILAPRAAAVEMTAHAASGMRLGLIFGQERTGLDTEDVAIAQAIVEIPTDPACFSLNLAQAVLLLAYEWRLAALAPVPSQPASEPPAKQADVLRLYEHLEGELERGGFFATQEQKPTMVRNLRALLARAEMTDQEVRTLRGAIKALVEPRIRRPRPPRNRR